MNGTMCASNPISRGHWVLTRKRQISSEYGIINRTYEADSGPPISQWTRLAQHINRLTSTAPPSISYKVLFLGRHGEGYHNLGEAKYGTKAWDDHWSLLDGDGELYWPDALLTKEGVAQAQAGAALWEKAEERQMPHPETYYVSPLSRCLQTSNHTFGGLENLPDGRPFRPIVKEMLRETNGVHTCDRRSSVTKLRESFPKEFMERFSFEPGFSDEDVLWSPTVRETDEETQVRVRLLLDDIFQHDNSTWISLTSHSGWIRALLAVVGHRVFPLGQGSALAVVVKAAEEST